MPVNQAQFDMNFSGEHTIDLLRSARSSAELSRMDRGDMYNLISELANRLETEYQSAVGRKHAVIGCKWESGS